VNDGAFQLAQPLPVLLVHVHHNAIGGFARAVQALRRGRSDVDPRAQPAREIAHRDRRVVRIGEAAGELDAFRVLEAIGQQPGHQEFVRFGRMPRQPERQLLVDLAVAVGEIDIEREDGCGKRHRNDDARNTAVPRDRDRVLA